MKAGVAPCCDPEPQGCADWTRGGRVKAGVATKPPCCDPEPSSSHKAALTEQKERDGRRMSFQSLRAVIQSRAQTTRPRLLDKRRTTD